MWPFKVSPLFTARAVRKPTDKLARSGAFGRAPGVNVNALAFASLNSRDSTGNGILFRDHASWRGLRKGRAETGESSGTAH